MIALIIISLLITGLFTSYFFKNQNDVYHLSRLQRKEQSVMLALKYFVVNNNVYQVNAELDRKLAELANIHNLDFNVYNEFGGLISTTISDDTKDFLAKESISSAIVDSVVNTNEAFIVEEDVENHSYLSTYFLLQNQDGKPIAVINVPYLKDSRRTNDDLWAFMNTLLQVFLLLFVGASLVAYFLSNYITKSLQVVSMRMKHTQLTGENPHLEWESDDEIGELVKDYNRMVDELQVSADMLAKSERESAWKEMAKQVAHEIKNPLTPMRLNIQHLQRSIMDKPDEVQERLNGFSKVMLEQIDTLARISNEFSNFAKMPRPEMELLNISDTIKSGVALYANTPNVNVLFKDNTEGKIIIKADRKQLIRCFSNLIMNAIQAIPSENEGNVVVTLMVEKKRTIITFSDNGKGISEEEKDKIFEPYFTTKSSGTGLGLAMVKNILQEFGAEITFESAVGEGTVFEIIWN
jgi:nitrogen fixation/metabolism regulation signal transduction histidine kinase